MGNSEIRIRPLQMYSESISGTGHRIHKFAKTDTEAFGIHVQLVDIASEYFKSFKEGSFDVNTGMALGWDLAIARAAYESKVPYNTIIPFHGQHHIWGKAWRNEYQFLMNEATSLMVADQLLVPNKSPKGLIVKALYDRNKMLMDLATRVVALYDGAKKGGTYGAICYANTLKLPVDNVWDSFKAKYPTNGDRHEESKSR